MQLSALIAAITAALVFVVIGSRILARVVDAYIGTLRDECDYLRAQLVEERKEREQERERSEALQRQLMRYQSELGFTGGALDEARRGGK